ncbi:hypothetical protein CCAN11_2440046 [Capnocytophaga canimorsus]|uniref:Type III R-M EcoP15I C-terminal domain-containing protein n=1 Tax=Capnocytophaga canimorsus TaxID=28188 RepID=A0A0B7IQR0_9FLAO|nr:hypothetical protein [Capnocytophaga canimorsus]CEN52362.1 hypothetical protein CCAN11_2440046 [Capnocytophaga canimorsus]
MGRLWLRGRYFFFTTVLFDTNKLSDEDIKNLLLTWKTSDGVELTQDLTPIALENYTAYYGANKLYLMHKGFSTENIKQILERIDSEADFSPTTIIIFGYHFDSKHQRELAENIKQYANKKNIELDFIVRY